MRLSIIAPVLTIVFSLQSGVAQDFRRTYEIGAGGQISIFNNLGDIHVKGFKGTTIEIVAIRKGPNREAIEIVDRSFGNRIELFPRYPQFPTGDTTVDFEVQVPAATGFNFGRLRSFNGNVEVSDVRGRVVAESVRGRVEIKNVSGLVSASSMSGNVSAEIDQIQGNCNMNFTSISGNIRVVASPDLSALVDMSSASGMLKTDFPIEIQERRYGPGRSARGRVGSGKQILRMASVSGSVDLVQK
jgi:hypothetical protein